MKIKDFYAYIEANSDPGSIIVFHETNSNDYYTMADMPYELDGRIGSRDMTLVFKPDPVGGVLLYRETLLDYLADLMNGQVSPRLKLQIALYNQDGTMWHGYLTDNLWSHVIAEGNNTFGLDNPFDYTDTKSVFDDFGMPGDGAGF